MKEGRNAQITLFVGGMTLGVSSCNALHRHRVHQHQRGLWLDGEVYSRCFTVFVRENMSETCAYLNRSLQNRSKDDSRGQPHKDNHINCVYQWQFHRDSTSNNSCEKAHKAKANASTRVAWSKSIPMVNYKSHAIPKPEITGRNRGTIISVRLRSLSTTLLTTIVLHLRHNRQLRSKKSWERMIYLVATDVPPSGVALKSILSKD